MVHTSIALPRDPIQPELRDGGLTTEARFRLRIAAETLLRRRPLDGAGGIARSLRQASIDLNPHQVGAAVAGLRALKQRGLVLADEVGLGKTVEAGLVLAQLHQEARPHLLVLCPASLRRQWANELGEKLGLESEVVDGPLEQRERRAGRSTSVFSRPGRVVIASHQYAGRKATELARIAWDAIIIDEAHRLRGAHRGSKIAQALRAALSGRPKLLLTATPLQNGLSELYGILSFLDEDLLGSFEDFRRMYPDRAALEATDALRERIGPFIQRTLRSQVREYVRYPDRKSVVTEFTPSPEEAALYDEVTRYLEDPETIAIDPARRHLMVLVYRKLLASSPSAIGAALSRLADGLAARLEDGLFEEEEDEDVQRLLSDLEDEGLGDAPLSPEERRRPVTPGRLKKEVEDLRRLAALASSIRISSKTRALLTALERAFLDFTGRGWPEKAVVFTESRRTQDTLEAVLSERGYQVATLNGQSGDADARAAIVEDFRGRAQVLILTEAGAEGLNLQFANLVVNYDLPWNPQRIEQRIGRCHRYGQTRDVVVLNFLASDNAAEARLYELLAEKLRLFDGVFGTTDEPLGALGDGSEFERRVHEIFSSCRSERAIEDAFANLRSEVEERIEAKMADARAQICEHFDDEVRARLRLIESETNEALAEDEAALLRLVQGSTRGAELDERGHLHLPATLGGHVLETSRKGSSAERRDLLTVDHPVAKGLIQALRAEPANEIRYVLFEYTANRHRISRLAPLLGSEGWWLVYRVSFDGILGEDHLVHVVLAKTSEGETIALDDAQIESLLSVRTRDIERRPRLRAATLASTEGDRALESKIELLEQGGRQRAEAERSRGLAHVEWVFEDRLEALRRTTTDAQAVWRDARLSAAAGEARRTFRDLERAMSREAEGRVQALERRRQSLAEIEAKSQLDVTRTLVATAYFWLE